MSAAENRPVRVVALWRYPFKSMLGEQVESLHFTERGADNDRLFALRELATHKLATARQYPQLLRHQAKLGSAGVHARNGSADVEVVCPDGTIFDAEDPALVQYFNSTFERKLTLAHAFSERDPKGLFDDSSVLLASVQSLASFSEMKPDSEFDPRRFRANIWVDTGETTHEAERRRPVRTPFPEQDWLGKRIRLGDELVLEVKQTCERCVMTTLPQYDLENDYSILKTIVQNNSGMLGIYCSIVSGGTVNVGDTLEVL